MRYLLILFVCLGCDGGGAIDSGQLDPDDVDNWPAPSCDAPPSLDVCPTGTGRWNRYAVIEGGVRTGYAFGKPGEPVSGVLESELCSSGPVGFPDQNAKGYAIVYSSDIAFELWKSDGSYVVIACRDGEQWGDRTCFDSDGVGEAC